MLLYSVCIRRDEGDITSTQTETNETEADRAAETRQSVDSTMLAHPGDSLQPRTEEPTICNAILSWCFRGDMAVSRPLVPMLFFAIPIASILMKNSQTVENMWCQSTVKIPDTKGFHGKVYR